MCRDCQGLSPTCVQAFISQGQESVGLNSTQHGDIICVPDPWNQKTGALLGNSSAHRPDVSLTAAARTQASTWEWPMSSRVPSTDMPRLVTASLPDARSEPAAGHIDTDTSRTGSETSSTSDSIETPFSTKISNQSKDTMGNGLLGFPGASSATHMLTIPNLGSKVLTLTQTITTLLTTTLPSVETKNK
jgi:hypothetical protein